MKRQGVLSLVLIALLQAYWWSQPVQLSFKLFAAVLVIGAIVRPATGTIVFAAIAPLSTIIAGFFGSYRLGAALLEQMALAIGVGVVLTSTASESRTRIGMPALLMATVSIASALAMIPAAAAPVSRDRLLGDLAVLQSAPASPVWAPLFVAFAMAACAVLGWAVERIVRRSPQLASRIVLAGLLGQTVAAALSVDALLRAAMRTGDTLDALPRLLLSIRLSMQTDWNAQASAFLLAAIAAFGLMKAPGLRRSIVLVLLLVVGAGLWITGSRMGIVLAVLAIIGTLGWLGIRNSRHRFALVGAIVAVIVAVGGWLVVGYPEGRNDKPGDTLRGRLVLMKAGLRMAGDSPLFGIGVDRFYDASPKYVGEDARQVTVPLPENAHNNFIQVLAEQGIVGLLAMLWWLAVVFISGAQAQSQQRSALAAALLLGVTVCVVTWLTGHPLLVPEFALVFWLYAGTLTALGPASQPAPVRRLGWVCVVALLLSVPIRAVTLRNSADLEYRGLGVSLWQHDDSQRYRNAGSSFALFLPASDRPVEVPIRRAPGAPDPLVVNILIDRRPVNRIVVAGDDWRAVQVTVPIGSSRFAQVDFQVERPAGFSGPLPDVLIRVGRESAR